MVFTASQIAQALDRDRSTVLRRAKTEGWPFDKKTGRGGKTRHYRLSGLPPDIQAKLAKKTTLPPEALTSLAPEAALAVRHPAAVQVIDVGSPELPAHQNRLALARADLLRAYLAEKSRAKENKEPVTEAGKLFIKGYNTGALLPQTFAALGPTSFSTIQAWAKKFKDADHDYRVLGGRYGNRLGQRKVTDAEWNAALSFALHPNRLRIAEAVRLTKLKLKKSGQVSPSSEATIRRALQDFKKTRFDLWVFAREGEKALNDKCLPYLERDAGLLDVGEVLVADGHKLNFQILSPFTGKPVRMTLLCWYDWASRMPVGWEIMPSENVQVVAASLRRAILTLGKPPRVAYLDNGRAFKAKVFTSKEIDFEKAGFYGMFARLGIETIFAWPYHAQSKPVERFFSTFNEIERLMPTYTGASIADKPARLLRNEKLHRAMHEKKYGGWIPTISEANQIITGWVESYATRAHRGLKGLCPGEVFAAGRGPGVDEKALRFLMMNLEIKTVGRNGVAFAGQHFYSEELYGYRDRVLIRYDLEDLSRVFVYDLTGSKFICEAAAVQAVHPVARLTGQPEDLDAVTAGIQLKRSLKKTTEQTARTFIEDAPALVALPTPEPTAPPVRKTTARLPRAEAERIEAEAAKMKVLELRPPEPVYQTEADRYEALLESEYQDRRELTLDEMQFMRYFEKTSVYACLRERYDFLIELFIAGPEDEEKAL